MKKHDINIVDSHIHLDHVYGNDAKNIQWLAEKKCLPVSWSFSTHIETRDDLRRYFESVSVLVRNLNKDRFPCFFLAGVHPRNIPQDLRAEQVRDLLLSYLEDPFCLGIGEIGLETGDAHEVDVFTAQVELAPLLRQMGKRIGIHTPRNNKAEITKRTLSLLDTHKGIEEISVIDHCTLETVSWVLEKGFRAGVSLSPIKTSLNELKQIVDGHPDSPSRIMCNTDSGVIFYDALNVFYTSDSFPADIRQKLACKNALDFFAINPANL